MSPIRFRGAVPLALAALVAAAPYAAHAQGHAVDPANDFLSPSYTGPHDPDLDVLEAWFTFDGTNFHLRSRQAGPINTASGHLFVWGINRGGGTVGFPGLAPGVLFDAVLAINPGIATNSVRDLPAAVSRPLPVGAVQVSGDVLEITVPKALLPSTGFALDQYTANLWPRSGVGGLEVIADFAPDNSNIAVLATPEPATVTLLVPALFGIIAVRRRLREREE